MHSREGPSVVEIWRRLEQLDDRMAEAFAARDTRTFRRLEINRRWWSDRLEFALNREGYPQTKEAHDNISGTTTETQGGRS
jgi:hypothetical protein